MPVEGPPRGASRSEPLPDPLGNSPPRAQKTNGFFANPVLRRAEKLVATGGLGVLRFYGESYQPKGLVERGLLLPLPWASRS